MSVITINGPIGCGAIEVGKLVSQKASLSYVDRMLFSEAAKVLGSPVPDLIRREQRFVSTVSRFTRVLQEALEKSAISGISGEPYFGRGMEMLSSETYTDLLSDNGGGKKISDDDFIKALSQVVKDISDSGDVVIIGRGSNMILSDVPNAVHVGMVGSLDLRVKIMTEREHLEQDQAVEYVDNLEKARVSFYKKFFKVHPDDPELYDVMLNMDHMSQDIASEMIIYASGRLPS